MIKQSDLNPVLLTKKSEHRKLSECSITYYKFMISTSSSELPQIILICSLPLHFYHQSEMKPASLFHHWTILSWFSSHLLAFLLSSSQVSLRSSLTDTCPLTVADVPQGDDLHSQGASSTDITMSPIYIPSPALTGLSVTGMCSTVRPHLH